MKQVFHFGHWEHNSSNLHNSHATRDGVVKTHAVREWSLRSEILDFYLWIFHRAVVCIFLGTSNQKEVYTVELLSCPEILYYCYIVLHKILKCTAQRAQHILRSGLYNFFPKPFPAELLTVAACFQLIQGARVRERPASARPSTILSLGSQPQLKDKALLHQMAKACSM